MLNQDEQIALFVDAINKNALKMRREIEKDTKKLYLEETQKLENAEKIKLGEKLAYAEKNVFNELNRSFAFEKTGCKKELYEKRSRLTDSVFEKAEEMLKNFTASSGYSGFLETSIKRINEYLKSDFTVFVKEGDRENALEAIKNTGAVCDVEEDKAIKIGGIRAESRKENKIINDTLDERLSEEREWFLFSVGKEINI